MFNSTTTKLRGCSFYFEKTKHDIPDRSGCEQFVNQGRPVQGRPEDHLVWASQALSSHLSPDK